ncbi:MAG: beta-N-acetylhexosaminidase [Flavobacteriales bacterium]|nr:MAG: beta-N-acetylhexosaminidase [Flavobacteriales bacterium]
MFSWYVFSTLGKYLSILLAVITLISCNNNSVKGNRKELAIIPMPASLKQTESGNFTINKLTKIRIDESLSAAADRFIEHVKNASGITISTDEQKSQNNIIIYYLDTTLAKEAYTLDVSKNSINIAGGDYNGLLYASETLLQLLPPAVYGDPQENLKLSIPVVSIKDQPEFPWRGLMLDVSRHFFGKEYIKKCIDRLAMHKMNKFHFHLIDDQGWRIEIKKYPKLTETGAWRVDQEDKHWNSRRKTKPDEKGTYGGFYTQEDLKEIVAYAAKKGVEVVPEIEMPAHVTSAIAAYPELACKGNPQPAVPSGGVWPITDIYCPGQESTFEFLENVLLEVMEIFPSDYIHIGADEATKTNWEKCPHCKKRIKDEGLENVKQLQSYFIKRIEKFLNDHDKNLIGWDEILEGGLAPNATVMSWRGMKGGIEAAEHGNDVIMTPGDWCYLDHYQGPHNLEPIAQDGYVPLHKVYEFEPIPESLSSDKAHHILGGQANLWSEYINTESHSEYMLYPRLAALAEVFWSPKHTRDWADFSNRLMVQIERYNAAGINYSKSSFLVTSDMEIDLEKREIKLQLRNEYPNPDIRYVMGDIPLNDKANIYKEPIKIDSTTVIKASLFEDDKPVGPVFTDTIKFHKAVAKNITYNIPCHDSYQGTGETSLVNTIRGTKNFHDGQWQAWLSKDMDVVIDLEKPVEVSKVTIGAMENQGPDIYYPTAVTVYLSDDGKNFKNAGQINRPYAANGGAGLMDFVITFAPQQTQYIRVVAKNLGVSPKGSDAWLFIDEIVVE